MIPWERLGAAPLPDGTGEMTLNRRGQEYSIRVDREELMNSRQHGSEAAMARLACDRLRKATRPRVLVGGLGMGFTLAATNDALPVIARVDVVELMAAVIEWNRGPMGELAGRPLADGRVNVLNEDVRGVLERSADTYDAILLDVDNGPDGLTQASNAWLYGTHGLRRAAKALRPKGVLSVWSAGPDNVFTKRLRATGFAVEVHEVRARANGKGPRHTIWIANKQP